MNAIILVVDRLHAGYLGAYGNTWIQTPAFDRLAAESFVFDQAFIDSPKPDSLYRALWLGRHALLPATSQESPILVALLSGAGITTALVTDEEALIRNPWATAFADLIEIPGATRTSPFAAVGDLTGVETCSPCLAATVEETHLARCFAQMIDWLESPREPYLLWCHLRGLAAPWDAPIDFRRAYADSGDPEPSQTAEVPCYKLMKDRDPDELLAVSHSYAGQVGLLDACLGALGEYLLSSPAGKETLLVVLSARGFPLGEHQRIGPVNDALHAELVHVPLLVRFPSGLGAAVRSQALVEPDDLWATLLDWWEIPRRPESPTARSLMPLVREEAEIVRDCLLIAGEIDERAIVTPSWFLRAGETPELFVQPDDRWQVNNVANRCPDIVELLEEALASRERALKSGQLSQVPPLADVLLEYQGT